MAQDPRVLLQKVRASTPYSYCRRLTLSIQAEKALQSASGGFSLFGGRQDKYENAADLYTQAANAFRVQKQSMDSGPTRAE